MQEHNIHKNAEEQRTATFKNMRSTREKVGCY